MEQQFEALSLGGGRASQMQKHQQQLLQAPRLLDLSNNQYPVLFANSCDIPSNRIRQPLSLESVMHEYMREKKKSQDLSQIKMEKDRLYRMILQQLKADGHEGLAEELAAVNGLPAEFAPNGALFEYLNMFFFIIKKYKEERDSRENFSSPPQIVAADSSSKFEVDSNNSDSFTSQSDSAVRVRKPTQPLNVLSKFGTIGIGPGYLDKPHGFCIGLNNSIVIADTNNHRISIFDLGGDFLGCFGEQGCEDGKLFQPRKVAMLPPTLLKGDENPVYIVCDRGSKRSRMQVFSCDGKFIRLIDIPFMDIVSGLTTTQDRKIVVVDSVRSNVLIIDEFGIIKNWFTCSQDMIEPSDIAVHNKHFYICDFKGHCVQVFNQHGVAVQKLTSAMIKFPNGIDVTDHGQIIVGDSHGNRFHVTVFDNNNNLVGDFDCPYLKVSRCCGLKITPDKGFIVTLAKNNHHVLVMNSISVDQRLYSD